MIRLFLQALRQSAAPIVVAAAAASLSGCRWFDPDLQRLVVEVRYTGHASSPQPTDVSVIAGADKFWWPQIGIGRTLSVTLFVDRHSASTLVLLFSLDGTPHAWESDGSASAGGCGFDLTIDANGQVRATRCKAPG